MFSILQVFFVGLVVSTLAKKPKEEIVGGEDIDIKEAPYQVSVMLKGGHICGGSVVRSDVIITAAHCFGLTPNINDYSIRAGSSSCREGGEIHQVSKILRHPNKMLDSLDYDVGILWLSEPISFSDNVKPIEMSDVGDEIPDGDDTIVTGWGTLSEGGVQPKTLQRVVVPKVNDAECAKDYEGKQKITPRMLCAGLKEGGKDSCQGDSGGPLVYNGKLAGIVSWGVGCARPDIPGVYSNVAALRKWIDETIGTSC